MPPNLMNLNTSSSTVGNSDLADITRPPPGFSTAATAATDAALMEVPYYKLPAGLMVEFVRVDDFDYAAIEPSLIKLPQLQAPSDNLLKAVDEFYNVTNKIRNA